MCWSVLCSYHEPLSQSKNGQLWRMLWGWLTKCRLKLCGFLKTFWQNGHVFSKLSSFWCFSISCSLLKNLQSQEHLIGELWTVLTCFWRVVLFGNDLPHCLQSWLLISWDLRWRFKEFDSVKNSPHSWQTLLTILIFERIDQLSPKNHWINMFSLPNSKNHF